MTSLTRTLLLALLVASVAGCGGGGGTRTTTGALTCGPTYKTPNYVEAIDPASNRSNILRYWPNFAITVYFTNEQTFDDNGTLVSTSDLSRTAISRWESAADGADLFTEVTSANGAQVTVSFNQLASAPGSGDTLGTTVVSFFPSNSQLISAEVVINTWVGMTRAQFIDGLKQTITHEFGHVLYLQGHSDNPADTMYYQSDPSVDGPLTTSDINSLQTAYCGDFTNNLTSRARPGEQPVTIKIDCPR